MDKDPPLSAFCGGAGAGLYCIEYGPVTQIGFLVTQKHGCLHTFSGTKKTASQISLIRPMNVCSILLRVSVLPHIGSASQVYVLRCIERRFCIACEGRSLCPCKLGFRFLTVGGSQMAQTLNKEIFGTRVARM